jgi:hypothetical protein
MARRNETGEGKASSILWLLVFAALAYAGWNVVPIYLDNYAFKDKMGEIARTPRGTFTDEKILDLLMKDVRERRLDGYIARNSFWISTLESSRSITCTYDRTATVLPGFNYTFHFNNAVDQPLIF